MGEFQEMVMTFFHAGTGVIPWVFLVILIAAFIYYRKDIQGWIEAKARAQEAIVKNEAERNEIIRNNSATIEACTAALEMVSNDRERFLGALDKHEELSKERIEHIQTVVNQCRDEVGKVRGEIGILLDRR